MTQHIAAAHFKYAASPADTVADVLKALLVVPDGVLTQSSATTFQATSDLAVLAGYIGGAGTVPGEAVDDDPVPVELVRAQLQSPSFRKVTDPDVRPLSGTAAPPSDPNMFNLLGNPLRLSCGSSLTVAAAPGTTGCDNFGLLALLILADEITPIPEGDSYWVSGEMTLTATAFSWTQAAVTWRNPLPPERFAVIGIDAFSADPDVVAVRLINPRNPGGLRPGCPCLSGPNGQQSSLFLNGDFGVLAEFTANMMPNVECLAIDAATTAKVVINLRIVPLGANGCGC